MMRFWTGATYTILPLNSHWLTHSHHRRTIAKQSILSICSEIMKVLNFSFTLLVPLFVLHFCLLLLCGAAHPPEFAIKNKSANSHLRHIQLFVAFSAKHIWCLFMLSFKNTHITKPTEYIASLMWSDWMNEWNKHIIIEAEQKNQKTTLKPNWIKTEGKQANKITNTHTHTQQCNHSTGKYQKWMILCSDCGNGGDAVTYIVFGLNNYVRDYFALFRSIPFNFIWFVCMYNDAHITSITWLFVRVCSAGGALARIGFNGRNWPILKMHLISFTFYFPTYSMRKVLWVPWTSYQRPFLICICSVNALWFTCNPFKFLIVCSQTWN